MTTSTITCARCGRTVPREHGAYHTYCTPDCRERDRKRRRRQRQAVQKAQHPLRPDLAAARTALYANRDRNRREWLSRERRSWALDGRVATPDRNDPAMGLAAARYRARKLAAEQDRWAAMGTPVETEGARAA